MSKRYIDIDDFRENAYYADTSIDIAEYIKVQGYADVVEVVRCRDCKHRHVSSRCGLFLGNAGDSEYFIERGDDFYCSYGERKE